MLNRRWPRLRALLALVLFAQGDGAAQLADALVFHTHTTHAQYPHLHGKDRCHAEQCELGVPIAPPPPIQHPDIGDRFAPVYRSAEPIAPVAVSIGRVVTSAHGSRAPPAFV